MKRRAMNWTLAVLTVLFVTPLAARADNTQIFSSTVCTTGSLILCNAFEVWSDGAGDYTLVVTNNAPGSTVPDPGFITGVGIFDLSGTNTYGLEYTYGAPAGWTDAIGPPSSSICNDLGSGGYPHQDLVVATCYNGSTTIQTVSIHFSSNTTLDGSEFRTDPNSTDGGILVAGDHTQGLGTCSAKFYSDGGVVTSDGTSLDNCYGTTVPEPATFFLLGTGLLGLAGVQWRRRRSANA